VEKTRNVGGLIATCVAYRMRTGRPRSAAGGRRLTASRITAFNSGVGTRYARAAATSSILGTAP